MSVAVGDGDVAREKSVSEWEPVARGDSGHSFGDWFSQFCDAESLIAFCCVQFRVFCCVVLTQTLNGAFY